MADDFGAYVEWMLLKDAKKHRVKRPPTTKAGKALHAVAAFFGAIARAVLRRKNAEAARQSLDVGGVLETFLREGERIRDASAARAEEAWNRTHTQTVTDEDGTEVAYHTAGTDSGSGMLSTQYSEGVGNITGMLALRLVAGHSVSIVPNDYEHSINVSLGRRSPYDSHGMKIHFGPDGKRVKGGSGLLHIVDERVANDYAELYKTNKEEAFKRAIVDALRVIETVQRGECVERRGKRGQEDMLAFELSDDSWESKVFETDILPVKKYRAVVYRDNATGDYNLTSGYRKDSRLAKTKKDSLGKSSVAPRRSEFLVPEYYGSLIQALPRLTRQIVAELFPDLQGENRNGDAGVERRDHVKVWSGAPMEFAVPSLAFVGTGTGGNNEGRGLYSSGVRGVAQGRYANYKVDQWKQAQAGEYALENLPIVYDGKAMRLVDAVRLIRKNMEEQGRVAPNREESTILTFVNEAENYLDDNGYLDYDGFRRYARHFHVTESPYVGFLRNLEEAERIMASPREKRTMYHMKQYKGSVNEWVVDNIFGRADKEEVRDVYAFTDQYGVVSYYDAEYVQKTYERLKREYEEKKEDIESEQARYEIERKHFESILPEENPIPPETLSLPAVMEQTWFTNRPEGDVSHLLSWLDPVTPEQMDWIVEAAEKAGFTEKEIAFLWGRHKKGESTPLSMGVYMRLEAIFHSRANNRELGSYTNDEVWDIHDNMVFTYGKPASEFLLTADIDGVRYPVNYRGGSRHGEEGWNYVAFSDEHLRVDHVYEYNPETDDFEKKWHEGGGSVPRFTETPLGQELVAKAFDVIVGVDADLLLRPWHYGEKREPGKGLVTAGLGRELDMNEAKGLAAEVSARISRFGTREGDPTLREIRARCGSKERFYEVMGAVFEAAVGLKLGVQDVITQREFGTMEKRMPLYAWVIRHNAQARATALGRKAYIMGRRFAERLHREALEAARAEAERQRAKASEARAGRRAAEGAARNAERREETERHKRMRAEFSAAEADFIARWRLAEERAISRMRIDTIREAMKASAVEARVREARKRAVERERGVSFQYLKGTLGVDIRAELRALAGADNDPAAVAGELLRKIELGFDKWVREQRPELIENSGSYWQLLNEQGEKAYRETMGNVLKAVARELSYGKLRESILNAVDLFAHSKHETVHDAMEGKLARVIGLLRIAQNADVVALTRRRIKSALAEANKRLSSEASSARTRYMASMRRLCRELLDTFEDAVDAQGLGKTAEKKRQNLTALKHALESEIENINDGKNIEDLAKDETVTERQHKDAVKLMFLERFGDLSYDLDPEKVWAKSAEAEAFVRDALFEHVLAWEAKKEAAAEMSARLMDALPQAKGWVKRGSVLFGALIPSWFDRMKWPLMGRGGSQEARARQGQAARAVIDEFERRFAQAALSEARAQTREAKAQTQQT